MIFEETQHAHAETYTPQPSPSLARVELVDALGEWFVRVTEKSGDSYTRTFEHKEYAVSFAEGQQSRLGVEAITRL